MPMIVVPFGEQGKEPELAPEGEYELSIREARYFTSKKGSRSYQVLFTFSGHPEFKPFSMYFGLPTSTDEANVQQMRTRMLRRLLTAFDVPYDDAGTMLPWVDTAPGTPGLIFDLHELGGKAAVVKVAVEEEKDGFEAKNVVRFPAVKSAAAA